MLDLPIISQGDVRPGISKVELAKTIPLKVGEIALVSCPAKSFQPASVVDCKNCPFCYGFELQKSAEYRSVCGYPIGRRITKVRL